VTGLHNVLNFVRTYLDGLADAPESGEVGVVSGGESGVVSSEEAQEGRALDDSNYSDESEWHDSDEDVVLQLRRLASLDPADASAFLDAANRRE